MKLSSKHFLVYLLVFASYNNSCKKDFVEQNGTSNSSSMLKYTDARDENPGIGLTVLGPKLNNPYEVDVIKQAYSNLYGQSIPNLLPTHLYVRYLPLSPQDFGWLDIENQEYWDFPLDYEIVHMGERYHDPSVQDTNYTWLYTVVPYGFQFPQIQYEILAQLVKVPYETHLLKEAYRLTNNAWNEPDAYLDSPYFNNGWFSWIVPPGEGGGGGGGGGGNESPCGCSVPDHIRKPSGCVTVEDNMLHSSDPVRHVQVITARDDLGLFFVETDETDDSGCYSISHKYHGTTRFWVKFKSDYCTIKTMTGQFDFLSYAFPRKAYKGKFNGPNFNNISIHFQRNTSIGGADCCNWLAATDNNALHEYRDWCGVNSVNSPPLGLKILVAPWQDGSGATVMLNYMPGFTAVLTALGAPNLLPILGIAFHSPLIPLLSTFIVPWLMVSAPDIVLNVNNPSRMNSDQIKEVAYHEFGHVSHWQAVNNGYWQANILYVVAVVTAPPFDDGPYGNGSDDGAGRCAVIESWGYHIGETVTDSHYGINSSCYSSQGFNFCPTATQSSYIRALEAFDPTDTTDLEHWIPSGIFHDLIDNVNETNLQVTDNTSGFTESQLFSCLNSTSIGSMKDKIQILSGNTQQTAVTTLFLSYGY